MSEINCESCVNLKENAPDFVTNGVTDDIAASLEANTGFNPNLDVLHDNCEDLNDANDCLIGMLGQEIETYSQCQWKEFMDIFLGNAYEMYKAIIASDCGLWDTIDDIVTQVEEPVYCRATGTVSTETSGTSSTQVTLATKSLYNDPDNIFSISDGGIKVSEAGVYRVTASVYVNPTADTTNVGCSSSKGTTFATSTMVTETLAGVGDSSVPRSVFGGVNIVSLNANDIVYLRSRCYGDAGTHYPDHAATYLLVEKVK